MRRDRGSATRAFFPPASAFGPLRGIDAVTKAPQRFARVGSRLVVTRRCYSIYNPFFARMAAAHRQLPDPKASLGDAGAGQPGPQRLDDLLREIAELRAPHTRGGHDHQRVAG